MADEVKEVKERGARKVREGLVVSDKMDKTAVVSIIRLKRHTLYGRVQRVTKRIKAHDENNECHVGDRVKIMETRPLSKDKNWRKPSMLLLNPVAIGWIEFAQNLPPAPNSCGKKLSRRSKQSRKPTKKNWKR